MKSYIKRDQELVADFEMQGPHIDVPKNIIYTQKLSMQAKMLWVYILSLISGDSPVPWPSVAQLASRAGMSEKTVRRYLIELEEKGFVAGHQLLADASTTGEKGNQFGPN